MNKKPVIISIIAATLIVAAAYFTGRQVFNTDHLKSEQSAQQLEINKEHRTTQDASVPTDTETLGQSETSIENEDTDTVPSLATENTDNTDGSQTRKIVQTSSNPLFADGVPEHLQCPEAFIGLYGDEVPTEAVDQMRQIADEVIGKYNPNRPLPDVWPQFIEEEKEYQASADPHKRTYGMGADRFDWQIQLLLDYPEIFVLLDEDFDRAANMRRAEMGWDPPDWNLYRLPDGREFRAADGYYYEVISSRSISDNEFSSSVIRFGHSGEDAPLVTIDLDQTSDEELERLSGWNYNINPYTTGLYKLGDNK